MSSYNRDGVYCAVRTGSLNIIRIIFISVHVRFVVYDITMGQVFVRVLLFYPVFIIPPLLHTHFNPLPLELDI